MPCMWLHCLQEQQQLPLLMGLEMPMVHVLASMEHRGFAFSSAALRSQMAPMEQRLGQLLDQAAEFIKSGNIEQVGLAVQ